MGFELRLCSACYCSDTVGITAKPLQMAHLILLFLMQNNFRCEIFETESFNVEY